jgi:hypothetical protein
MTAHELIAAYVDDVARRLERGRRNDVGVELRTLLDDELQEQAGIAGRPADEAMAMELLRRFGRPEDVAARYRTPGFPVIDAADAPSFVRLAAIGMAAIWIVGLVATFRGGSGLAQLGAWWMTYGLGAFWWPGFLVVCVGAASWVRRRFPIVDDWKPAAIDPDRINRTAWVVAIAAAALGTIWLTSPAQFVEQLTGGRLAREFYQNLVYDDTFRQWRLPLLLALLIAQIVLFSTLVAHGRWQRLTRRADIALSAAITTLLVWSLTAGRIFQSDVSNQIVKAVVLLVAVIAIRDIAMKVRREMARVHMPTVAKRA